MLVRSFPRKEVRTHQVGGESRREDVCENIDSDGDPPVQVVERRGGSSPLDRNGKENVQSMLVSSTSKRVFLTLSTFARVLTPIQLWIPYARIETTPLMAPLQSRVKKIVSEGSDARNTKRAISLEVVEERRLSVAHLSLDRELSMDVKFTWNTR